MNRMNTIRRHYRYFHIGHSPIIISSRNEAALELVGNWMGKFEVPAEQADNAPLRMTVIAYESNDRIPFILPQSASLLHKNDDTRYYEYRNLSFILLQTATVILNRTKNKIIAFAHYNDLKRPEYLEDFMHPLVELLRQNGVYAHHAGAVSLNGRGLLLVGKSGQGKTTLAVDLLSHGLDFLSDDRCFISETLEGFEVQGYYEPVRFFPKNISHVKELEASAEEQSLPALHNHKSQLDLYPRYGDKIIDKSLLDGLIFPHYSPDEPVSRIEPMQQSEAMVTLLPLTMVCFDRSTSKHHFSFCTKLTAKLPAVKLIMGKDHVRWHMLVRSFLDAIPRDETTASSDLEDPRYN